MNYLEEILNRNTAKIFPNKKDLLAKLQTSKKLRIYLGIDPSSSKIHLGNAIALRKLAEFQNLGHKIILLIGDFTGMIGDPTDKSATRLPLTREQVLENAKDYKNQSAKILNFSGKNPAEIAYNSTWLANLNFSEIVKLSSNFTVSQLLERDMFQERMKKNKPIGLHEFLYPVMQGYDSVMLDVDMEVGGTDQTFNMLVGRHLQKLLNNKEKFVLTLPLLEGLDGRKMSKSFNNSIDIDEKPIDMFGKLMGIDDNLVQKYFEMCTDLSLVEIEEIKKQLAKNNPIEFKKKLAHEVTRIYHGEAEANAAEKYFEEVIQRGSLPKEIEEVKFAKETLPKPYLYFLIETGLCRSNSEAIRLGQQGGISFDNQKITNVQENFSTDKNSVIIKVGKRRFITVKFI